MILDESLDRFKVFGNIIYCYCCRTTYKEGCCKSGTTEQTLALFYSLMYVFNTFSDTYYV